MVVIDVQNGFDDPKWGTRNNPKAEECIAILIDAWRVNAACTGSTERSSKFSSEHHALATALQRTSDELFVVAIAVNVNGLDERNTGLSRALCTIGDGISMNLIDSKLPPLDHANLRQAFGRAKTALTNLSVSADDDATAVKDAERAQRAGTG